MKLYKPFYNCNIFYNKNVLIPRKETEFIVDEALKIIPSNIPYSILDLGTGSGCISIAILNILEQADFAYKKVSITGVDISKKAIKVALYNKNHILTSLKSNYSILESDLFSNLNNEKYNMILANLPYIDHDNIKDLPISVQQEPHIALDGGNYGLDIIEKALKDSVNHLEDSGILIFEADPWQINTIRDLSNQIFNKQVYILKDYSGNDRLILIK